jgi:PAS domain S-box-containing protein
MGSGSGGVPKTALGRAVPVARVAPLPDASASLADAVSARLAAIVDSSDDAIISKTLDGTITTWNRAAEQLFGYAAREIIGRSIFTMVPPEMHEAHKAIMARLARGERIAHLETERVRKDGARVEVSLSISPIHDSSGRIIGASKIARDISGRRKLERQKQQFLEMIAHDLGTPLTVIQGYAQLLQRRQKYDEQAVEAIIEKAHLMARLVADMLDMARLEAGHLELHRAEVDLVELVHGTVANAAMIHGDRRIRVDAPDQAISGAWDADRLAQVLTNLLENALKYAPDGEIVARVTAGQAEARVAVIDRGPGLRPEELQRVFEHYFRGRRTASLTRGAGLGLFISKAIVEAHGGRLWAESTTGEGSTFAFSLPLDPAGPPEPGGIEPAS